MAERHRRSRTQRRLGNRFSAGPQTNERAGQSGAIGKIVWTRDVEAVQPEDRYQGMGVPEHGYATNSPVTDGQTVFAFLGKSGVLAFDLEGNQLWKVSVGTESGNRGWGTAASLMLYQDLLIVNAANLCGSRKRR